MTEYRLPTEQELDMLLEQTPVFDLNTVKQKTFSVIEMKEEKTIKCKLPLRRIFVAAVVCALSVSMMAAAEYVSGGSISRVLGIQKAPVEAVAEENEPPEEVLPEEPAEVEPQPKPAVKPVEPEPLPELDEQIAGALQVSPQQKETLRPAVQNVGQSAEAKEVQMTVLQTVGDPACIYAKVRFDFPTDVPISMEYGFEDIEMTFELAGLSGGGHPVIERTANSVTYLLKSYAVGLGPEGFSGLPATVSFKNYGMKREVDGSHVMLQTKEGKAEKFIIDSQMNIVVDATEENLAAIPGALESTEQLGKGFTLGHMSDGTLVLDYDGTYGVQYVTVFTDGEYPQIMVGDNPRFDTVVEGNWSQSWTVEYQDTSRYWNGEEGVFDPSLTMKSLRISPFSWEAVFEGDELAQIKLPKKWDAQLLHTDGSLSNFPMTRNMTSPYMDDWRCTLKTLQIFDETVDLSGVKSVIIDGKEFPLS